MIWAPPSDDGGSPVVGYVLRWREGTSGTWTEVQLEASARSYLFTNLVGGGYYQVKLSAKNTDPDGEPREGRPAIKGLNPCSVGQQILGGLSYVYCADAPPPNPPRPGGKLSLTPGEESLTAVWGATVASEGDAAVAGFRVSWRRERGRLEPGSGWDWEDIENATLSSHLIDGLTGGVPYQVKVQSFSSEGRLSPALMRDGVPDVADACRTSAEPGFWDQVFDPVLGLCVEPPGSFDVEVEEGDGKLSVSVEWELSGVYYHHDLGVWRNYSRYTAWNSWVPGRLSEVPVSDYVVRWRRRGSSAWAGSTTISHRDALLNPNRLYIEKGSVPYYGAPVHFVVDVHVIEGLVNGERYEVQVEARNIAGSNTSLGYGDPCATSEEYDVARGECVAPPPAAEGVVLTSGDQSLTLRWRQREDAAVDFHYVQLLHGSSDSVLDGVRVVWDDGVEKTVGGKEVREWSHTFLHQIRPGWWQFAPAGVRLSNGQSYRVRVTPRNAAGDGEAVVMLGSPCEDCSTEVSKPQPPPTPPPPPPPVVCSAGEVLISNQCSPCPQGQVHPGGSNCVTPTIPTRARGGYSISVIPGPRAGDLWIRWYSPSFNNGGLPLAGYKIRWRRLDGSFTEQEHPLIPLSAVVQSDSRPHRYHDLYGRPQVSAGYDLQYIISGLAVGARYTVSIAAVNQLGESNHRIHGTAATACGQPSTRHYLNNRDMRAFIPGEGICIFRPRPPTSLTSTPAAAGAVNVSWEQHNWDNYYPVTAYQLQWRPQGSSATWTPVEPPVPWTAGTAYTTTGGEPRRRFTHTITGLTGATTTAGAAIEVRVASLNQFPPDHEFNFIFAHHSTWVTTTATTCPTGQARLSAATGCTAIPALPTAAPPARTPTLTLHPGTGPTRYITAAWWQNTGAFDPVEYTLEWKQSGAATWNTRTLPSADVNVPLPPDTSYTDWTLNAHSLTRLDMCTHDVRVTAVRNTQQPQASATVSAAPQGTVTAPEEPQDARVLEGSEAGDQLYVYWKRPECDGGATLNQYQVSYKLTTDTAWTDEPLITSAAELARVHNGHIITGLTAGTEYDVKITVRNSRNLTDEVSGDYTPEVVNDPTVAGDHVWRPYRMPSNRYAMVSERIQMGLTIRVCTSAQDLVAPLQRAVAAWNAVLADNKLNSPGETPTPRSDTAPAGAFEFSGTASAPADCGEANNSGMMRTDNQGFEAVIMDYRLTCPITTPPGDACCPTGTSTSTSCCSIDDILANDKKGCCRITDDQHAACCPITPTSVNDCDDTSCASTRHSTPSEQTARSIETADNCAASVTLCSVRSAACVRVDEGSGLRPRKTSAQVAHIVRRLTNRTFTHELGHYLLLTDYGNGCHWISDDTTEKSLMSYGSNRNDWRDWRRLVNTQNDEAFECRADTITRRDQEDLHSIYHPAAFRSLNTRIIPGAPASSNRPATPAMEHFVVGLPPQDLEGNSHYNAYRYVILHRAPQGSSSVPNAFTPLMNGSTPVALTQEQLTDTDIVPQNSVDAGELDANGNFVLTSVDLNDSVYTALRATGHEFVFVGVTRGDPQRDPGKPLNPVSAANLAHAIIPLDLGLPASTGLDGVRNWTLGTPVLYVHP